MDSISLTFVLIAGTGLILYFSIIASTKRHIRNNKGYLKKTELGFSTIKSELPGRSLEEHGENLMLMTAFLIYHCGRALNGATVQDNTLYQQWLMYGGKTENQEEIYQIIKKYQFILGRAFEAFAELNNADFPTKRSKAEDLCLKWEELLLSLRGSRPEIVQMTYNQVEELLFELYIPEFDYSEKPQLQSQIESILKKMTSERTLDLTFQFADEKNFEKDGIIGKIVRCKELISERKKAFDQLPYRIEKLESYKEEIFNYINFPQIINAIDFENYINKQLINIHQLAEKTQIKEAENAYNSLVHLLDNMNTLIKKLEHIEYEQKLIDENIQKLGDIEENRNLKYADAHFKNLQKIIKENENVEEFEKTIDLISSRTGKALFEIQQIISAKESLHELGNEIQALLQKISVYYKVIWTELLNYDRTNIQDIFDNLMNAENTLKDAYQNLPEKSTETLVKEVKLIQIKITRSKNWLEKLEERYHKLKGIEKSFEDKVKDVEKSIYDAEKHQNTRKFFKDLIEQSKDTLREARVFFLAKKMIECEHILKSAQNIADQALRQGKQKDRNA